MKNNKPFIFAGIFSIFFAVFIIGMTIITKNRETENPKKVVFEVVFKKISANSIEEGEDCEDNYNYSNKCRENKDVKNTAKIKVKSSDGSKFRLKNFKPKISYFNLNNEKTKEDNREYTSLSHISLPFTQNDKYFEVEKDLKFIETYIFDNEADKVEIEYSGKKFTFESDDFKKKQYNDKLVTEKAKEAERRKVKDFTESYIKELEKSSKRLEDDFNNPNTHPGEKGGSFINLRNLYNNCINPIIKEDKYLYANIPCEKYKPLPERYLPLYESLPLRRR